MRKNPNKVRPAQYQQYNADTVEERQLSLWPGICLAFLMYYSGYTYLDTLYTGILFLIIGLGWNWLLIRTLDILWLRGLPVIAAAATIAFGIVKAFSFPIWILAVGCIGFVFLKRYAKDKG